MSKSLLLLGARGMGKVVLEALEGQNIFTEIALLDTNANYNTLFSYPILGKCDEMEKYKGKYTHAFVSIGDNEVRTAYLQRLIDLGFEIPTIIHPRAYISKSASLGIGVFVNVNAIINASCKIGNGCVINSGAIVEHDNQLGECVHMCPNSTTTGDVIIGDKVFVGAGSCIINGIQIGSNVVIAAGSTVISNFPDNVMVAGNPAVIKKHRT